MKLHLYRIPYTRYMALSPLLDLLTCCRSDRRKEESKESNRIESNRIEESKNERALFHTEADELNEQLNVVLKADEQASDRRRETRGRGPVAARFS